MSIRKHRVVDLFGGSGGSGMGWYRAGFDVTVVDHRPQPRIPSVLKFVQTDAMTFPLDEFDILYAGPPCQRYCAMTPAGARENHPDLIEAVRERFVKTGKPFVIENVPGAPLKNWFQLCGTMFGLPGLRRHRKFETNFHVFPEAQCDHGKYKKQYRSLSHDGRASGALSRWVGVYGECNFRGEFPLRCHAMGIDWMINRELTQAIPPAYTEWIGRYVLENNILEDGS